MSSRENRVRLIREIENLNGSHVIVYFTGDRTGASARIAEDAVRPLYQHLLTLSNESTPKKRIDLFIYSRGGDVSVPWRITTMIREFCQDFAVLVPYRAHSAATMIALGADKIVMGRKAELSPIDPTLVRAVSGETAAPPQEISVEDVSSYIAFVRERANLNDQSALAKMVSLLANQITPLALGNVNRQYSHIRLVARKLLASHRKRLDEERMASIIEALTEKMYSHGHAISRHEADELGLPVEYPKPKLEELMWNLYLEYESMFKLTDPLIAGPGDVENLLNGREEHIIDNIKIACIESTKRLDVFEHRICIRRRRQVPNNPQINCNINLQFPPNINIQSLPQNIRTALHQLMQQITQTISQIVQQELIRQSPPVGVEMHTFGGRWQEVQELQEAQ